MSCTWKGLPSPTSLPACARDSRLADEPLCRGGTVQQRLDLLEQAGVHLHPFGEAALPGLVSTLRRQARTLAGNAVEELLGARQMSGRRAAQETFGIDRYDQLPAERRGSGAAIGGERLRARHVADSGASDEPDH